MGPERGESVKKTPMQKFVNVIQKVTHGCVTPDQDRLCGPQEIQRLSERSLFTMNVTTGRYQSIRRSDVNQICRGFRRSIRGSTRVDVYISPSPSTGGLILQIFWEQKI